MVFTLSGAYLLRRRGRSAFIAGLGALFFLGALMVQVRGLDNAGNPGAFDYRGYLADHGIVALASTKAASVEVLPGFAGSRAELWRSRIHRSVIDEVHALWPPHQAALMDAMVIGEDAFINRPTRADFQRSGTYHVLVVSGME
jgi:competence protein ComEC